MNDLWSLNFSTLVSPIQSFHSLSPSISPYPFSPKIPSLSFVQPWGQRQCKQRIINASMSHHSVHKFLWNQAQVFTPFLHYFSLFYYLYICSTIGQYQEMVRIKLAITERHIHTKQWVKFPVGWIRVTLLNQHFLIITLVLTIFHFVYVSQEFACCSQFPPNHFRCTLSDDPSNDCQWSVK